MDHGTVWIRILAPLAMILFFTLTASAHPGGVAIVNTVISDNGDDDGFADTNETVSVRLKVRNTRDDDLTGVTISLVTLDPDLVCVTQPTIDVGDLAAGEERLTDDAFVFFVLEDTDRESMGLGPLQDLSASFELTVSSDTGGKAAFPAVLTFDLDLDVSGGGGSSIFFESFEQTLGAFEIENLDQGIHTLPGSDGYRCQYADPDWVNSNTYGTEWAEFCHLGSTLENADAVWWGLSGPGFSPLGGRGFSGFHALFFGIDLGPPENWTTPLGVVEAVKTTEPINLGWDGVSPSLSMQHQIGIADGSWLYDPPHTKSADQAVVMVQLADQVDNPTGDWIKLDPYLNPYDTQSYLNYYNCMFDPVDDGTTEDDFFDPSDPDRELGPSSTCFPEYSYSNVGETSEPFQADNIGNADGPGRPGQWGIGTWVESKFDLERFRGKRIRLRFLVTTIEGNKAGAGTWEELLPGNPHPGDDGWWIDDVTLSGALATAASLSVDSNDNGALPAPVGDVDGDGVFDVCDNCLAAGNPDQTDTDGDGTGDSCDPCPVQPFLEDGPDADGICGNLDNCPLDYNPAQTDSDWDGFGAACDCDDSEHDNHPGAEEVNDGVDNNCNGVADETSNDSGFHHPGDKNEYSWPPQEGAVWYLVARGDAVDFSIGCTTFGPSPLTRLTDTDPLASGGIRFYLNRAFAPNAGSWGLDSAGLERSVPCD